MQKIIGKVTSGKSGKHTKNENMKLQTLGITEDQVIHYHATRGKRSPQSEWRYKMTGGRML
jgi:hypothetical protein